MLVQTYRRTVPGHDAFIERTLVRDRQLCVALVRTRNLALDRGVIAGAVEFAKRFRRPQISIVLDGEGYFDVQGRVVSFGAGDLAETDQRAHRGEGYGGRTCEVIIVDWDEPAPSAAPKAASVGAIGRTERAALHQHAGRLREMPPAAWVAELLHRLRACGLAVAPYHEAAPPLASPRSLVRLYQSMGSVLSRIDEHPSLDDLAAAMNASPRQTRRWLAALTQSYAHPFSSWRDFIHEMRLDWATQLLSVPGLSLDRVAALAGYRSTAALHHAYSTRGAATPRAISRRLNERWG